ncbi:hypothetical protein PENSUB_1930 [Penicillium subrubescens]|uniref:RNase H type-1 domain-containing protein n=1 Tax=Penicillium subrubescens TaxID=1316194 RepID=A0A1Q5UIZ3_9EURO|nr:hypothetical protein PENSUB_1930 [Penicillium subrubescens]
MKRTISEFTKVQRRAAILISGAFKSTSAAALNVELFITPMHLLMDQIIQETAIRIQTGAVWAQPDSLCCAPRSLQEHGSGYEGQVGASAVAPREGVFQRRYLGTSEESTVYVAELNGIEMAIANLSNRPEGRRPTKTVIFSDCQAAIQAVQNPKRSSG